MTNILTTTFTVKNVVVSGNGLPTFLTDDLFHGLCVCVECFRYSERDRDFS